MDFEGPAAWVAVDERTGEQALEGGIEFQWMGRQTLKERPQLAGPLDEEVFWNAIRGEVGTHSQQFR